MWTASWHLVRWVVVVALPRAIAAQASYYDLDAGRPTRVEDAVPIERYGLGVQLVPTALERLDAGTTRVRLEPKLAFGALPLTELEFRAPYVYTRSRDGRTSTSGLTGIGFGVLRALTIERRQLPALAVFGEVLVPAGGAAGAPLAYSLKGAMTKSTTLGRVHVNVAGGTYGLPAPAPSGTLPSLPDPPCDVAPLDRIGAARTAAHAASRARCGAPAVLSQAQAVVADSSRSGGRLFAGLGVDHALPLHSVLFSAAAYVERFTGPFVSTDWTVEFGLRHQVTPQMVLDGGVARRLAGVAPSTSVTVGLTYGIAIRSTSTTTRRATSPEAP